MVAYLLIVCNGGVYSAFVCSPGASDSLIICNGIVDSAVVMVLEVDSPIVCNRVVDSAIIMMLVTDLSLAIRHLGESIIPDPDMRTSIHTLHRILIEPSTPLSCLYVV